MRKSDPKTSAGAFRDVTPRAHEQRYDRVRAAALGCPSGSQASVPTNRFRFQRDPQPPISPPRGHQRGTKGKGPGLRVRLGRFAAESTKAIRRLTSQIW